MKQTNTISYLVSGGDDYDVVFVLFIVVENQLVFHNVNQHNFLPAISPILRLVQIVLMTDQVNLKKKSKTGMIASVQENKSKHTRG